MVVRLLSAWGAVAATSLAATALVACAASPAIRSQEDAPLDPAEADPTFSGPYSTDYLDAWRETESSFVREVIRDERITDQEWAEVATRLETCLSAHGIRFLGFEPEGGYSVDPGAVSGEEAHTLLGECELESGEIPIGRLRLNAVINPQNDDLDELIAACLVRKGGVEPGYTGDDYREDQPDSVPLLDPIGGRQVEVECSSDPLDVIDEG